MGVFFKSERWSAYEEEMFYYSFRSNIVLIFFKRVKFSRSISSNRIWMYFLVIFNRGIITYSSALTRRFVFSTSLASFLTISSSFAKRRTEIGRSMLWILKELYNYLFLIPVKPLLQNSPSPIRWWAQLSDRLRHFPFSGYRSHQWWWALYPQVQARQPFRMLNITLKTGNRYPFTIAVVAEYNKEALKMPRPQPIAI